MAIKNLASLFFLIFCAPHEGVTFIQAAAAAKDSEAGPASREAPFRHRNLDYWDAETLAAYLSVSPTHPHTPLTTNGDIDNEDDNDPTPYYAGNDAAVLLYAQWCQNCHALAPMWDQIAGIIHAGTTKSNVIMALFDCEQTPQHKTLCGAAGVTHYPTMLFIGKGTYHDTDPVTSTLMGKDRSAGPMGRSPISHTVKFQGDWRYGEQVMDWISVMKGLSSYSKWMEGSGKANEGGIMGKALRWLIRPFSPMKAAALTSKDGTGNGEQMPVGIPPELKMQYTLAEAQSTVGAGTGAGAGSASTKEDSVAMAQVLAQKKKLENDVDQISAEKDLHEQASTHSSLLIDLLLFTPMEAPETDAQKTTLAVGQDVFSTLYSSWDDYAKLGEILLDKTINDKTIPLVQSCVVDMTIDYCTRFVTKNALEVYEMLGAEKGDVENRDEIIAEIQAREEPYCNIFENCVSTDFDGEECRPESCPLLNPMGCRYVSSCLDQSLIGEYVKATENLLSEYDLGDASAAGADQGASSKGGWGIS